MSLFHVKLPSCPYRYIRFVRQPDVLYVNICVPPSKVEAVLFDNSILHV